MQLWLSWKNPDPIRRHYYDSGSIEGLGFYAEEMMLLAGLFDDSPHSREIIYNFMRLRALRVEVDVKLALGQMNNEQAAAYLAKAVPMSPKTAQAEAAMFSTQPGQAISYQTGKLQIMKFLADARVKAGDKFDLKAFHDFVWSNGNVPIELQRAEWFGDSPLAPAAALTKTTSATAKDASAPKPKPQAPARRRAEAELSASVSEALRTAIHGTRSEANSRELKELRSLTGDANGAQRVAWTDTWLKAREWFASEASRSAGHASLRQRGNNWVTLAGASEKSLLIGGHLDSVPNGGWLDGSLNVLAGLEILRRIAAQYNGKPPVTVKLVDWADEEGARFGRSLLGSSAFAGTASVDADRVRTDRDGIKMEDALRRCGVEMDRFGEATQGQKERRRLHRTSHRARSRARKNESASRDGPRHKRRRAPRDHISRPGSALRLNSNERASRRAGRRRKIRARNSHDRWQTFRFGLHHGQRENIPRHCHSRRRPLRNCARSTRPRSRRARADVSRSARSQRALCPRRKMHRRMVAHLEHRTHRIPSAPARSVRRRNL